MPELPEVETIARDLQQNVRKLHIDRVEVLDSRVLRKLSAQEFSKTLKGRTFENFTRRGKAVIGWLDNGYHLVIQPMMTGQAVVVSPKTPLENIVTPATKVIFRLSNGGHLLYNDQRLFGQLHYVKDCSEIKYFRIIGPEPLSDGFTIEWIAAHAKRRKVPVKSFLMDHTFVAGIGNIYASEILFRAGISPKRRTSSLKRQEVTVLHRMIREVLEEAIEQRGTSMRNYRDGYGEEGNFMKRIKVYGRETEACPSCKKPIQKIVQSGRSTFYCKQCQK